ncbi:MAG: cysteine desulfurase family protein, partial [Acidimicrobiales bacterium]
VEDARDTVARHLGCDPGEVVFTAGGTESCNLAVLGAHRARRGAVLCSAVEHRSVLGACAALGASTVPVDAAGALDLKALEERLHPGIGLVSVMLANNEVGTIQPLAAAADLVRRLSPRALVHTDAIGAASLDLAAEAGPADLVSIGAHKFGGPKGVGALVVRGAPQLGPVLFGGPQERDRRPGTHDVAGIVGMAAALEATVAGRPVENARVRALRDRLVDGVRATVDGVIETGVRPLPDGSPDRRAKLAASCHLLFEGVDQEELLVLLDEAGVYASAGAACASGALEPSHVLLAMGYSPAQARRALRLSLGYTTTVGEVDEAVRVVAKSVERLRGGTPPAA